MVHDRNECRGFVREYLGLSSEYEPEATVSPCEGGYFLKPNLKFNELK